MGMSIDEAIKQLETYSIPCGKYKEAYDFAIDTMRKYQKIEQIIRNYDVAWKFHTLRGTIDKIREVVEDGQTNY